MSAVAFSSNTITFVGLKARRFKVGLRGNLILIS